MFMPETVRIEGEIGMPFQFGIDTFRGGVRDFVYDINKPAVLKRESMGCDVDRYC